MYKVFINNRPLTLAAMPFEGNYQQDTLFLRYDAPSLLLELITQAHTVGEHFPAVLLAHSDADVLLQAFENSCTVIEAAGGRVTNPAGKLLLIFRSGKWDLPKGKIDAGETPEQAAVREVEEECGISGLRITRALTTTWHTYMYAGKPVIKKTWWFAMETADTRKLKPQQEEGITDVAWLDAIGVYNAMKNTFNSVAEVINA